MVNERKTRMMMMMMMRDHHLRLPEAVWYPSRGDIDKGNGFPAGWLESELRGSSGVNEKQWCGIIFMFIVIFNIHYYWFALNN